MAKLKFTTIAETPISTSASFKHPAIAIGSDDRFRIAADTADMKQVWFWEQTQTRWAEQLIAQAGAKTKGANKVLAAGAYVPSLALGNGFAAVAFRCRKKGWEKVPGVLHGPGLVVIPDGCEKGPFHFCGFTTGAVRVARESDSRIALFSKDGDGQYYLVAGSGLIEDGRFYVDIGATGEKIVYIRVGASWWAAMGGCSSEDDSQVASYLFGRRTWMNCDVYHEAGSDVTAYPGMGVKSNGTIYLGVCLRGRLFFNKVTAAGVVQFSPANLPSIGPADSMDRHPVQFVPCLGRMAAVWSDDGNIMAADVDAARTGKTAPSVVCRGNLAAACNRPGGMSLAVIRKGQLIHVPVAIAKEK